MAAGQLPLEAARIGHLDILKWAMAEGCEMDLRTFNFAAEGGHLDALSPQWT